MANKEFRIYECKWRHDGAASARKRKNPIDHGVVGRIMFAVKDQSECNARRMPPCHAYTGPGLDSYRGGSAKREQRKSRGPDHVSGYRFECGK
jgi:hypothetical protein